MRTPAVGVFKAMKSIGDLVSEGEIIGFVDNEEVRKAVAGVIRGLIREGTKVWPGLELGDVDPRGSKAFCYSISDKARAIAGSVLEAVLRVYNR